MTRQIQHNASKKIDRQGNLIWHLHLNYLFIRERIEGRVVGKG